MFLLDTNICVYALTNRFGAATSLRTNRDRGIAIAAPILAELRSCARRVHEQYRDVNPTDVDAFVDRYIDIVYPTDEFVWDRYTSVVTELANSLKLSSDKLMLLDPKSGRPLKQTGRIDVLIAAHALVNNVPIVTHNAADFATVQAFFPELRVDTSWCHEQTPRES